MQKQGMKWMRGVAGAVVLTLWVSVQVAFAGNALLLATTTSTDNTGLLDYLAPLFTKATGIELKWVATGTGKALKLGENCDADVLMVHAPFAEKQYIQEGFGVERREIMYNDFILIGPHQDPADLQGQKVCAALKQIERRQSVFVSRGDNSGTNKKEIGLWKECVRKVPDRQPWYLQTGQGMLATINVASERSGYTLTDRGTFIKYTANFQGTPPMGILVQGDSGLVNQYSVIGVNPVRCPKVQNRLARKFADWLVSSGGQEAIGSFRLLDRQLFHPNAAR